jgi:segregation and condensation protein B
LDMMLGDGAADAVGEAQPGPGLRACLEAILLVVDEPVPEVVLAQVLERPREEIALEIATLAASYDDEGRGFDLREVAGGWRFYTREECAPVVERFVRDGQEVRLTQAALETLAAYRQPVSRARVSAVRGVNCDGVMRTLTLRGLVEEAGTEHETGAILYRTTGYFLERLGLAGLDEMPDLAPFLPDEIEDVDGVEEGIPGIDHAPDTGSAPDSDGSHDTDRSQDTDGSHDTDHPQDTDGSHDTDHPQDTDSSHDTDHPQDTGTLQDPQGAGHAGDEHPGQ